MEALNSTESRRLTPAQSMRLLEKQVAMADQRVAIRKSGVMKGRHLLGFLVGIPLSAYMIKNGMASNGVMHNHKSGSGTYMHGVQNFMYPMKTITQTWRPELDLKE